MSAGELGELYRWLAERRDLEQLALSRRLHDGPLQELIGVSFHLGALQARLGDTPAGGELARVQSDIRRVLVALRTICTELYPPVLGEFGLEQAIRAHARQFQRSYPEIQLELDLDPDRAALPGEIGLALYHIFQALLDNAGKHSRAGRIRVRLAVEERTIYLAVTDDGCGFLIPRHWMDFARLGQLGLVEARSRTAALGGRFAVRSAPGRGTAARVALPRPAKPATQEERIS